MKFEIKTDTVRNILYIKFVGFHQADDARQDLAQLKQAASRLRPGFALINDISEFVVGDERGFELLKQGMVFLKAAGCRRVIRVVSKAVASLQFSRASGQVGYEAETAYSVAEAERMLVQEPPTAGHG